MRSSDDFSWLVRWRGDHAASREPHVATHAAVRFGCALLVLEGKLNLMKVPFALLRRETVQMPGLAFWHRTP